MSNYKSKSPWFKRVLVTKNLPVFFLVMVAFITLHIYRLNDPLPVGTEIENFKLKTLTGEEFSIYDINQPIVLVFYKKHTFYSTYVYNSYYNRLLAELKFLQDRGYAEIVVISDGYDTVDKLKELIKDKDHSVLGKIGYVADTDAVSEYFGVRSYPHLFVLNKDKVVTYEAKLVSTEFIKDNVLWR